MANATLTDPVVSTGPTETLKKTFPPPGAVGWEGFLPPSEQSFEFKERPANDVPLEDIMKLPEHKPNMPSSGSIPFNSSPSISIIENPLPEPVTQVAGEAVGWMGEAFHGAPELFQSIAGDIGKDLIVNQILGLGEQPAGIAEKKPMTEVEIKAQNDAREIKRITAWAQEIASNSFRERQTDLMEQSLRITGGPITDEDVTKVGFSGGFSKEHLLNIATMGTVGEKRSEIVQMVEEQEKKAPIPSPAKQAYAVETQYEGGSGKYGSGTASLSAVNATG